MGLRGTLAVIAVVGFAASGFASATVIAPDASAHQDPCHSQHTCPSDHHTYVWLDLTTGLFWDCAEPGAPEYDATRDTTKIIYAGLTYYCRAAGGTTTTSTTWTTSTTTTTGPIATTAPEPQTSSTTGTTGTTPQPELVLPNPSMTPGAYNRNVRPQTIRTTICVSGWTKKVRPPVSYTNALKVKQMARYDETGSPSEYEEDHFIPLELGGAPRNPKNLWPEPHAQSRVSDPLETKLKTRVCHGAMSLAAARRAIRAYKFAHG
jgi:hypothetical protein